MQLQDSRSLPEYTLMGDMLYLRSFGSDCSWSSCTQATRLDKRMSKTRDVDLELNCTCHVNEIETLHIRVRGSDSIDGSVMTLDYLEQGRWNNGAGHWERRGSGVDALKHLTPGL